MTDRPGFPRFLGDLIATNSAKLTDADTRLLDVLMQDPLRAVIENGTEVSSRAGVHPASAVRLARRFGFAGYPEFRAYLRSNLMESLEGDPDDPAARLVAGLANAEEGQLLSSVLDGEIAALQRLRNALSDADIRPFSQAVRDARRVFLLGRGHAATLSAYTTIKLRRSGYDAIDLSAQLPQLSEAVNTMSEADVIWLMSFRRPSAIINDVRAVARERGTKTLILSDINGGRLDPPPDHQIAYSRGGAGESQSMVVPMTIVNAVILDLAAIDDGHSLRSLDAFKAFRSNLPSSFGR